MYCIMLLNNKKIKLALDKLPSLCYIIYINNNINNIILLIINKNKKEKI